MNKKKLKLNIKNVIVLLLMFVFICMIVYSSIKIVHYIYNTNNTHELVEQLDEYIEISKEDEDDIKIDFDKLRVANPDTVGWIRVNNTNISFPVVKGTNNDYYLRHNFLKRYSESGWIFANYLNKFDGTDDNIVIFGHAMKNKTMFGELNKVMDEEWLKDESNKKIQFITDEGVQVYKIFSIYKIQSEDYYITTHFTKEDYDTFINTIMDRSIYNFNEDKKDITKVLTLSTCYDNHNNRLVVHAYKVM